MLLSEIVSGTEATTEILVSIRSALDKLGNRTENTPQSTVVAAPTVSSPTAFNLDHHSSLSLPLMASSALHPTSVQHNQFTTPPPPFQSIGRGGQLAGGAGVSGHEAYGGAVGGRGRGRGRGTGKKLHQRDKIQAKKALKYTSEHATPPTIESLQQQLFLLQQQNLPK